MNPKNKAVELSAADVLFLAGAILLVIGLALWSVPLALVVVGALLLVAGVLAHRAAQRIEAGAGNDSKARAPAGEGES